MLIVLFITIILILSFGLFDYFSSRFAFKLYSKKLKNYYEYEIFELNPYQRDSVEGGKYNLWHLIGLLFICALLSISYYIGFNEFSFFQGFSVSFFGYIVSRNVRTLIIYHKFNNNPKALIGKVKETYFYTLDRLLGEVIGVTIFLLIIFVFIPSFFTFGLVLGPLLMLFQGKKWKKKYKLNGKIDY